MQAVATQGPGDATRLAREASEAGMKRVFALGGDGTIREAAAGILGRGAALGVLPGGTTNVVAGALGLPRYSPVAAARLLASAHCSEIDVGRCGGEIFLMQASTGLDAAVMATMRPGLKRFAGRLGVALSGIATWWSYDYPELSIEADGETIEGVGFAAVCNLAHYAGAFRLIPHASCRDRQLDLLLCRARGRSKSLGLILDFLAGRQVARSDVEIRAVTEVHFGSTAPVQVDGDVLSECRGVRIELNNERLAVLLPAGTDPSDL